MFESFKANLHVQMRALVSLKELLEEEFSRLMVRDPQAVSAIELRIQETLRQLAQTRMELRRIGLRDEEESRGLSERLRELPAERAAELKGLLDEIDAQEQERAREAARNQGLALALAEQNKKLLGFLHDSLAPRPAASYSAAGRYVKAAVQGPALMARRL